MLEENAEVAGVLAQKTAKDAALGTAIANYEAQRILMDAAEDAMWTAEDAYWTDFYNVVGDATETIFDDAWYEARATEKEVPFDSATGNGNEYWSAKVAAMEALDTLRPTYDMAMSQRDAAQAEFDYILHLEEIASAGSAE
jgi:hypothetical protein